MNLNFKLILSTEDLQIYFSATLKDFLKFVLVTFDRFFGVETINNFECRNLLITVN